MTPQAIGIIITIFIAWSGFLVGVIKWLLKNNTVDRSSQIEGLKVEIERLNATVTLLQQEIAIKYVRKSDFNRCRDLSNAGSASVERKIDELKTTIYEKIEDLIKEINYARTK